MSKRTIRNMSAIVCFTMLLGLFSFAADIREAAAAVTRVAVVTELKGTVKVKKSGGAKSFNAFKNMSLNEGDLITTGKNSSIVLQLADSKADKDEITVGENSQVNFSKLEEKKGTKAKMNVWAGSLWVKVKSISNADDTFEIETPTAIMGVRGTHFIVGVDPVTGETRFYVASGVVQTRSVQPTDSRQQGNTVGGAGSVTVYPAQQISMIPGDRDTDLRDLVEVVDIDQIISTAPPSVIESLIKNMLSIQNENEEMIERLQQDGGSDPDSNLVLTDQEVLERYRSNVDNMLHNMLKSAVNNGVIAGDEAQRLIDQANEAIQDSAKKFDLNREVPPLDRTAGLDPQREQQRAAAEQKRQQQLAEKERKKQEVQQRNADLIDQIVRAAQELQQANERAQQEKQQQATDRLLEQLTGDQRNALQQRIEQKKAEQQQQQGPGQPATSPGSSPNPGPSTPSPGMTIPTPEAVSTPGAPVVLDVHLSNFSSSNAIYGYQVDVTFDDRYFTFDRSAFNYTEDGQANAYRNLASSPFKVELADGWQPPADYSVNAVDHYFVKENASEPDVLTYTVLKFTGNAEPVSNGLVVKLPFMLTGIPAASGTVAFTVTLTPVDAEGNVIAERTATVNVQVNV